MRVAIGSGKGGTGKTTVAVNLAVAAAPVSLLDCDVEDPDSGLFLHTGQRQAEEVIVEVPQVDADLCNYCGKCSRFCAFNAITVLQNQWLLSPELCKACGGCYRVCPQDALSETTRRMGIVESGQTEEGVRLVSGKLDLGEAMATPVIREVWKRAPMEGSAIIDCPPGSACAFVSAVEPADFCLLVTEPTPFGVHDLGKALDVLAVMGKPAGVVVNRSDGGDNRVWELCAQRQVPVLMEIPFDENLARQYAHGKVASVIDSHWRERFEGLWEVISDQLEKQDISARSA